MSNMNDIPEVPYWADRIPQNEPNLPDVPEHLGGHYGYTNMDRPSLDFLKRNYNIKSMLDVGCGTGGMVEYARSIGITAYGVDGDHHQQSKYIYTHDFTTGVFNYKRGFDLIWCVEFVEHVKEEYIPSILEVFKAGRILMMTFAPPGQGGKHHVNLQDADYWEDRLKDDWVIDKGATAYIRASTMILPYMEQATVRIKK
jgi:SAM-dependent methyltransferase